MKIPGEVLERESRHLGFHPEVLEKVIQLLNLLEALNRHPYLKTKFLLKGGTALNLFLLDVPRLSVDIDVNYIGRPDRTEMLEERPRILDAVKTVFAREGLRPDLPFREDYAAVSMEALYESDFFVGGAKLKVDANFLSRVPLWPGRKMDSRPVGPWAAQGIPVVDLHELAAGKIAALMDRRASRDLFDAVQIFRMEGLDPERLRLACVIYGGAGGCDWRSVTSGELAFNHRELKNELVPTLARGTWQGTADVYGAQLVEECRAGLDLIFPLRENERDFLDRLLDRGILEPERLTEDPALAERIRNNPPLRWRAQCVQRRI